MKILSGEEARKGLEYIDNAAIAAAYSCCFRSKCGSVIVKDDVIIGKGSNAPPLDIRLEQCLKDTLPADFKSDKTCCLHAEQRAIVDALQYHPDQLSGSRLYFVRLDEQGQKKKSGDPYCTICSKFALDMGVTEFVLYREEGICVYDTFEYNELSFRFRG